MLSCEAVGGVPETTIPFGIALEYLHNSTLIHDDIIDKDRWRRGLQTTHEKFGIPFAIIQEMHSSVRHTACFPTWLLQN